MGREQTIWKTLGHAIRLASREWKDSPRFTHRTADVLRVHLFSTLRERPIDWACDADNWPRGWLAFRLPDQSTMSRRTRGANGAKLEQFMALVARHLDGDAKQALLDASLLQTRRIDGTALTVAAHSSDPDARWGRGAGQKMKGYKLHVLRSVGPMPEQFAVTALNVDERVVAARFLQRLHRGAGYVIGDSLYDSSELHERALAVDHHLLVPRRQSTRGKGLGHRFQSEQRVRCLAMLEPPKALPGGACVREVGTDYGATLHAGRTEVERDFGHAKSFGGGLRTGLPAWVRRAWRVRKHVISKLLIDGARRRARA